MIPGKNIEDLLHAYFLGVLSEEEGRFVDEWICESAEHRRAAREICALEQLIEGTSQPDGTDCNIALDKVHARMRRDSGRRFWSRLRNYAALLALPLLAATIWFASRYYKAEDSVDVTISSVAGMTSSTTLPDGSMVWLNSNSRLSYPSRFSGNREVTVEGEAFFKVVKKEGSKFVVHAKGASIEVLGTEFDVEAYPTDGLVRATLLRGSVLFSVPSDSQAPRSFTLKPGERYTWDASDGTLLRANVNPSTAAAWRDGRIILENTSLADALRQIGNRFNVEFLIRNEALLGQRYTGTFTEQRLEVVLEHFRRTTDIHFDYQLMGTDTRNISGRQKIIVY